MIKINFNYAVNFGTFHFELYIISVITEEMYKMCTFKYKIEKVEANLNEEQVMTQWKREIVSYAKVRSKSTHQQNCALAFKSMRNAWDNDKAFFFVAHKYFWISGH